jgi:predicted dehydrogenase
MRGRVPIGIVGTGLIGRIHAAAAQRTADVELAALCSVDQGATEFARELGVPLWRDYRRLAEGMAEGVVVATPNDLHAEMGIFFAEHGVPMLVEKPIAASVAAGAQLCAAAEEHGVTLLVGHHRRHDRLVRAARTVVTTQIGRLLATHAMVAMRKPDSYYDHAWRRDSDAGPLMVNLIHEVDLLRAVCGEIDRVQAVASRLNRTFAFDDTAAVLLQFRDGAVGTVIVSDSTPAPWSWEAAADQTFGFHHSDVDYLQVLGTEGALGFPSMTVWSYDAADGEAGWRAPLHAERIEVERNDPYVAQLAHFARIVRGLEAPLVSGRDGLRSLAVVAAVVKAARTGGVVDVEEV